MLTALIDAGPLIAFFDADDARHAQAQSFINGFRGKFVTTAPVITETMWHLKRDYRVQNELLLLIARSLICQEPLTESDFSRIAELNERYADLPSDFADLSLIAVAERLGIEHIASFDKEFDIYQRRKGRSSLPFKRLIGN